MKYLLLINVDPTAYPDAASAEKMHAEYMSFTQSIVESGELVSGEALQGPDTATTVRLRDGQVSLTDGPYVETKEHLGGYYLIDVKDLDRASELASQIPDARTGGIEIRPVWEVMG
jgi:hypothetical protein